MGLDASGRSSANHNNYNNNPNLSPRSSRGLSLRLKSRRLRTEELIRRVEARLASNDISASSRLTGYIFIFTAYCVLFVSSIKYEQPDEGFERINDAVNVLEAEIEMDMEDDNGDGDGNGNDNYNGIPQPLKLSDWKMKCTIYGSATYIAIIIIIISVHFDRYAFPNFWRNMFKNGSRGECTILSILMIFSIFMLYVSTSTTGLGGFAGAKTNVFFSSWLGCIAAAHTFDLWWIASGKERIGDILKKKCQTNYNWSWTFLFSFITLLSLLDTFLESGVQHMMEIVNLTMIISPSVSCVCCMFAIVMNTWCCKGGIHNTVRQWIEGLLLVLMCSFWCWVVFRFTGIHGIVNGPSNSYFGVWGAFFFSISTVGVWVKEYQEHRLSR